MKRIFVFLVLCLSITSMSHGYTRYGFDIKLSKQVEPDFDPANPYGHVTLGENLAFNILNVEHYYTRQYSLRNTIGVGLGLQNNTNFLTTYHEVMNNFNVNNNIKIGLGLNSQIMPMYNYDAVNSEVSYYAKNQLLSYISIAPVIDFRISFDQPNGEIPNTYGLSYTYRNYKIDGYKVKGSQLTFYYGFVY